MKHNTMKVGNKVREIPDGFGWVMKEGVGIVLKVYNVGEETRVDVDFGDGGIYIYFIEQLENV
nr:MAG TPA: ATP-dependent DNA helicase [Caudoviricetes sp.]